MHYAFQSILDNSKREPNKIWVDQFKNSRIQKFMQTGDTNYIYKNELNQVCSQYDMAYGKCKDLKKHNQIKF